MFLKNKDTIAYYYALNDMAFETAMNGDKHTTLFLMDKIEYSCTDTDILTKLLETKAELYIHTMQYDSALYYASELCKKSNYYPIGKLVQAQVYSMWGMKDSAVFYAEQVLDCSDDLSDMHNALYILTNDDESKDETAIRETAADRSDVQKILRIQQGKLSQAVQLLEQDITRIPNLTWLYAIIITSFIIGGFFYWRNSIRRKQMHTQIEQIIERQSDSIIQSIKQHIDINDLAQTLHWKNYITMKADADLYMGGIVSKLESRNLNETEIRFCILTMLDLSLEQIANTIHYSYPSGIKTLKKRISVKLSTIPQNLRDYLFQMTTNVSFESKHS